MNEEFYLAGLIEICMKEEDPSSRLLKTIKLCKFFENNKNKFGCNVVSVFLIRLKDWENDCEELFQNGIINYQLKKEFLDITNRCLNIECVF